MFEEVQTTTGGTFRHPQVDNLYDVFLNIREDECAHVKMMTTLQEVDARQRFYSPHTVFTAAEALPIDGEV